MLTWRWCRAEERGCLHAAPPVAPPEPPTYLSIMAITIDELDRRIARFMHEWGIPFLRISLAIIFIWFGVLKPFGWSPAEPLVLATVDWLPILEPAQWLAVIGWWEVLIGICFLFRPTIRLAIGLLLLQMGGTFMPLVLLPEVTFQAGGFPWQPTMEGQYIIKNLLILSAAVVIGGTVRGDTGSVDR